MRKMLLGLAAAAAMAAPATASATPITTPTCDKYVPTCDVREAADVVVGVVVHALWPTLRHVQPLVEEITP